MASINDINIDFQTLDYTIVENISSPIIINLETSSQSFSSSEWWDNIYSYQNVQSIGLANSTINTGSGNDVIDIITTAEASTLNFFGVSSEIDFIVEDNKLKHNKLIPGVNIPIKNKSHVKDKNNVLVVLAWNFFKDIKNNNTNLSDNFINIKDLESSN